MPDTALRPIRLAANRYSIGMIFLGAIVIGAAMLLWFTTRHQTTGLAIIIVGMVVFGIGIILWYGVDLLISEPRLVLDAGGLVYRVPGLSAVAIPWGAVAAIEYRTIEVEYPLQRQEGLWATGEPVMVTIPDATLIVMPADFYERAIGNRGWWAKGPGWNSVFLREGDVVRMVLDARAYPVPADRLRTWVVERWRAAGGGTAA